MCFFFLPVEFAWRQHVFLEWPACVDDQHLCVAPDLYTLSYVASEFVFAFLSSPSLLVVRVWVYTYCWGVVLTTTLIVLPVNPYLKFSQGMTDESWSHVNCGTNCAQCGDDVAAEQFFLLYKDLPWTLLIFSLDTAASCIAFHWEYLSPRSWSWHFIISRSLLFYHQKHSCTRSHCKVLCCLFLDSILAHI